MKPFKFYVLWTFMQHFTFSCCLQFNSTEINEFHQNSQLLFKKQNPFKLCIILTMKTQSFLFQENKKSFCYFLAMNKLPGTLSPPIFIEQNQETSKPHTIGLSCAEIQAEVFSTTEALYCFITYTEVYERGTCLVNLTLNK